MKVNGIYSRDDKEDNNHHYENINEVINSRWNEIDAYQSKLSK